MTRRELLEIVESIYDAAVEPRLWRVFLERVSAALGGPAVAMTLALPRLERPAYHFALHLGAEPIPLILTHLGHGLPWGDPLDARWRGRFGHGAECFPDEAVASTPFYREWMAPQGLAPQGPIGHIVHVADGIPTSGLCIFRRVGGPPLGEAQRAGLDALVPHLAEAYAIHQSFGGAVRERIAVAEVLDRLPQGVALVDDRGAVLVSNRMADRMLESGELIRLQSGFLRAASPEADRELQEVLRRVSAGFARALSEPGAVVPLPRSRGPGGSAAVAQLLEPSPGHGLRTAVASVILTDPELVPRSTAAVLGALYGLTPAEAELLQLLVAGGTLEEAARGRGVALGTARKQLAQVFAKTGTHRQGELLELVLRGVGSLG